MNAGDRMAILRRIENVRPGDRIRLLDEDTAVVVDSIHPTFNRKSGFTMWIVGDKFPTRLDTGTEVEVIQQ